MSHTIASSKRPARPLSPPRTPTDDTDSDVAQAPVCGGSPKRRRAGRTACCGLLGLRQALAVATPQFPLVDRKSQEEHLRSFLVSAVSDGKGASLYVCGAPGTGKTATTLRVLTELETEWSGRAATSPTLTILNAMQCHDPRSVYSKILSSIAPPSSASKPVPVKNAEDALQRFILAKPGPKRKMHIVCIDEIDALDSAGQAVLYRLFQLPHQAGSSLVLIGIANRINLPELLVPKLSKVKLERLLFEPYTEAQLVSIISARCGSEASVFHPAALILCARKVSQKSAGDARKALELAGVAVDVASSRHSCGGAASGRCWEGTLVTVGDMAAALAQIYRSTSADALACYPLAMQVLVCSVVHAIAPSTPSCASAAGGPPSPPRPTKSKAKPVTLAALRTAHNAMCKAVAVTAPDSATFMELVERLAVDGIVSVGKGVEPSKRVIALCVDVSDIAAVMSSNPLWAHV